MISEKRSQAARANGAHSRGPVTPEGKAISSRNAMRHGLLAKTVVLANENPKRFEELFYLLVERFSPVDDVEMSAIEEMAAAHWRLRRVIAMEHAILDKGIATCPEEVPAEQTAAVFCDPANLQSLALLNRYDASPEYVPARPPHPRPPAQNPAPDRPAAGARTHRARAKRTQGDQCLQHGRVFERHPSATRSAAGVPRNTRWPRFDRHYAHGTDD